MAAAHLIIYSFLVACLRNGQLPSRSDGRAETFTRVDPLAASLQGIVIKVKHRGASFGGISPRKLCDDKRTIAPDDAIPLA